MNLDRRAAPAALLLLVALVAGCGGSSSPSGTGSTTLPGSTEPGTVASSTTASTTTAAADTAQATDAGETTPSAAGGAPVAEDADQPQTQELPDPDSPAFQARMQALWSAIVSDDPQPALNAFFPLGAYEQVKAISDPASDYQNRLIAAFEQDIHDLHQQLGGADATFEGVDVPTGDAEWIQPGVEANKGAYWRVYDTTLRYTADGEEHTMPVTSLISWRGQWYVVHLGAIR